MNEDITILGWTRDKKGKVVNLHSVGVANAVTANKRDNTQNYVVEPFVVARPHGYYAGGEYADVSPCCKSSAMAENNFVKEGFRIRKFTPRECFRLMGCDEPTIDKLLSAGISNSQLYKLAGNSIVVDVLYHIFRRMLVDTDVQKGEQLVIF